MESNENACVHHCNLISDILNKQTKEFKNILVNSLCCIFLICSNGECNMAVGGGEVASYKGGGECHILAKG